MPDTKGYDQAAHEIRRPMVGTRDHALTMRELVRFATLAASSHYTQPWKFHLSPNATTIHLDFTRRGAVVDPDDAHLFKSLGCAAENLVHAAAALGFATEVSTDERAGAVAVRLERSAAARPGELFQAIPLRQRTKTRYDGSELKAEQLKILETAGTGQGVRPILLTARGQAETIVEYVRAGNRAQLTDPAFRKGLVSRIRFNAPAALRTGDGLAGRTSGQPSLPEWFARLIIGIGFVLTPKKQAEIDAANLRSSSAVGVFASARDDKPGWVEIGRAYERFALEATALELRNAFINPPIEVPSLRMQRESWLSLKGERASLLVRIGRAPQAPSGVN